MRKTMSNNPTAVSGPVSTSSLSQPIPSPAPGDEAKSDQVIYTQSQQDKEIKAKIKAAIAVGDLSSCLMDSQSDKSDSEVDTPCDSEIYESQNETRKSTERELDCARRQQHDVLTGPQKTGRKRKTYSEKDYNMIINASDNFKRRIIADALGMPWKTALAIMNRYRRDGKVTDGRHGSNPVKLRQKNTQCNPYSVVNLGKWGKLSKRYENYLFHLLHLNCAIFATDLQELINREMQRDYLLDKTIQDGVALGIRELTKAEREVGGPLNTTAFEHDERFKVFCKTNVIHSSQTIRNHLMNASYTRKRRTIERTIANTESAMERRLRVAHVLCTLLEGKVGKVCLLFQDEMQFYIHQHQKRSISKKREKAVHRNSPTSNTSFLTQLSMAVHPKLGIFTTKRYNCSKKGCVDKNGKQKSKCKSGNEMKDFEDFLHTIMRDIVGVFESKDTAAFDAFNGARIYLFYEGSPEHGKNAMKGMIDRFTEKDKFDDLMQRYGCTFEQFKLNPNSPHLNLCEYYCRMLRVHVTRECNAPEVHKILQIAQGDPEAETTGSNTMQNRVDAIHSCIERAIKHVGDKSQALENFNNFSRWVQKVIDSEGYLNYYEPI